MLVLPTSSGETVTGDFKEYFTPHAKIQVGDYLQYNPIMDKMVVVPISDRPNYKMCEKPTPLGVGWIAQR